EGRGAPACGRGAGPDLLLAPASEAGVVAPGGPVARGEAGPGEAGHADQAQGDGAVAVLAQGGHAQGQPAQGNDAVGEGEPAGEGVDGSSGRARRGGAVRVG